MKFFNNLSIALKLGIAFGVVIFLGAIIAYTGWIAVDKLGGEGQNLTTKAMPRMLAIGELEASARDLRIYAMRLTFTDTVEATKDGIKNLQAERLRWEEAVDHYRKACFDPADKANLEKVVAENKVQEEYGDQIIAAMTAGKQKEAIAIADGEARAHFRKTMTATIHELSEWNLAYANGLTKEFEKTVVSSHVSVVVALACAVIVGLAFCWLIIRQLRRSLDLLASQMATLEGTDLTALSNAMEHMQSGDLTVSVQAVTTPIADPGNDEIGKMTRLFNSMLAKAHGTLDAYEAMRGNLAVMVGNLKENADLVASTSAQLDRASEETGQAANSIAETIQQVANASNESAKSANQIAAGSEQLAKSSTEAANEMEKLQFSISEVQTGGLKQDEATREASETATAGRQAVDRTVASMERIQEQVGISSVAVQDLGEKGQQIGVIVQTIEDIAQQTNLLALNAAIEAARAGEQGKGFAVVADEVRKLAERSSEATKEIAILIDSVRSGVDQAVAAMESTNVEVTEGSATSSDAGIAISQIMSAVETVRSIAVANGRAIDTMGHGAKIVSESIASAAAISEETAAGAEEMSATTEEVSASAQTVSAAVEEQTAQIEEVSASAQHLRRLADDLNSVVAQFKVEEGQSLKLRVAA